MEKQDLQNFLLLPLLFLRRLFLTQVSSLTVTHSSTSFTVTLHIKGRGNCKGKHTWSCSSANACPTPTADLIQAHSYFLGKDLQHVMPVWKQRFFCNYHCNIMLLVFKMFYLLQRQTDLQTNTLQTDFIEAKLPSQRSQLVTQTKTIAFIKLLINLSNKVTTDSMTEEHQHVTASHPLKGSQSTTGCQCRSPHRPNNSMAAIFLHWNVLLFQLQ